VALTHGRRGSHRPLESDLFLLGVTGQSDSYIGREARPERRTVENSAVPDDHALALELLDTPGAG
jgi:hypothetical protein